MTITHEQKRNIMTLLANVPIGKVSELILAEAESPAIKRTMIRDFTRDLGRKSNKNEMLLIVLELG